MQSLGRVLFLCAILLPSGVSASGASKICASPGIAAEDVEGLVFESSDVNQAAAERIFAAAEAALYFPRAKRARWLERPMSSAARPLEVHEPRTSLRQFQDDLERDFPGFREDGDAPFLLKLPARAEPAAFDEPSVGADAVAFTDSFESGLSNWVLSNNTLDLYGWGTTPCASRTGSVSADAIRGGINVLTCTDAYAPNVLTSMKHRDCEAVDGASQAWLDAYVSIASESGYDTLGFFYPLPSGDHWGYVLSGTWSGWFHVVFNLEQWYVVGDVTATPCPRVMLQFSSDEDTQSGYGARVDDLTVSTSAPAFLSCAIVASSTQGPAPLTVNFSPSVTGASSATAYHWSFGDAAPTTATTQAASFTYTSPGEYSVRLRVEDQGVRAYAHRVISVSAGPSCSLSCNAIVPNTVSVGSAAAFQASSTPANCSGSPTYAWTFGDGQSSTAQNPTHAYSSPGSYTWTMTSSVGSVTCTRTGTIAVTTSTSSSARRRAVRHPVPGSPDELATKTIGTGGGTLSGGGFTLTVPAGAFATNATLRLSKVTAPRDEGDVSDTYLITGLPDRLQAPVTASITRQASEAPAANVRQYFLIDGSTYSKSGPADAANRIVALPLEAVLSGATITATVPAHWPVPGSTAPSAGSVVAYDGDRSAQWKAAERVLLESPHFYATARKSDTATAQAILSSLEEHYQKLVALGFSFDCRGSGAGFRKIPVLPQNLGSGSDAPLGYHVSGNDPCGNNWVFASDSLEITTSFPATTPRVRAAGAHELFHLVQDMYSPGGAAANLWLKEASSIWFENAVLPSVCPDVQISYATFPYHGLFNCRNSAVDAWWASDRQRRHGYGASYVLKYRTDASGVVNDPFVSVIWGAIRSGSSEIGALQAALGSSLPAYWTAFSRSYFNGRDSGQCFPTWASFSTYETLTNEKSIPKSFELDAYPLSAISWNLGLTTFKTDTPFETAIAADGLKSGQTVYLYDVKAKKDLVELTEASPRYEIPDLNAFSGSVIILVFVDTNLPDMGDPNAQSPTNKVTLKIGADLVRCHAKYVVATYKNSLPSGGYELCRDGGCNLYWGSVRDRFLGEIVNDQFLYNEMWCAEPPEGCAWREFTNVDNDLAFRFAGTAAAPREAIRDFRLRLSFTDRFGDQQSESIDVAGQIPLFATSSSGFQYRLTGAGVCSAVTHVKSGIYDVGCNASSYFELSCDTPPPAP